MWLVGLCHHACLRGCYTILCSEKRIVGVHVIKCPYLCGLLSSNQVLAVDCGIEVSKEGHLLISLMTQPDPAFLSSAGTLEQRALRAALLMTSAC